MTTPIPDTRLPLMRDNYPAWRLLTHRVELDVTTIPKGVLNASKVNRQAIVVSMMDDFSNADVTAYFTPEEALAISNALILAVCRLLREREGGE